MFEEFDVLEGQMSLFEQPIFKIDKPIRLIELFAGIGSQAKALENLNANFEHYRVCEFDEFAIRSYNAVHHTNFETSDITELKGQDLQIVDTDKFIYIVTYSFPCQDLSLAGNQKGMSKGNNTRSGLLWEVERLLNECEELPQVLLMENVPQVHAERNAADFRKWISFLENKGYSSFYDDLNAKNYGIPQNRNRCFMVSILGNYDYVFPPKCVLTLRLKDLLETNVNEKYYLSEKAIESIRNSNFAQKQNQLQTGDICGTLLSRDYKDPKCVIVREATKQGYAEAYEGDSINLDQPNSKTRRGRVGKQVAQTLTTSCNQAVVEPIAYDEQNNYFRKDGCIGTLTTDGSSPKHNNRIIETNLRIRKIIPKEAWRLMGFDDEDFENAKKVNSNSQLYKQAGNSIVVNVLEAIFKQMM